MDVFRSDLGRHAVGVAGYSHPDFFKREATEDRYRREIVELFGQDNLKRELLYHPFPFRTRFGDVQLQFVSNSCGTMYLNWRLIADMRRIFYPRMEKEWLHATYNKGRAARWLNDGAMSQGLSYFWMEYARLRQWDTNVYGGLIDIMPSVANHLCAGGITGNAPRLHEGETFVGSPSFPLNYNEDSRSADPSLRQPRSGFLRRDETVR
jgi:hypothetical protein